MPDDLQISEPTTAGTGNPTLTFRFILFLVLFCQRYFTVNTNDRNSYSFLSLAVIEERGIRPSIFYLNLQKNKKNVGGIFILRVEVTSSI